MALTTRLPSARVEPFYGFVESTGDALRLIQAARQGIIPRITRRLNDLERRAMIRSGAIFIFNDEESGIKRWTEGLSWSASRIVGNFLVYREVSDRSNARVATEGRRSAKLRGSANELSAAELAEQRLAKALVGCLSDGSGRFRPNGLVKKTITVNVDGSDHHLVAYYSQDDVRLGKLLPLASRPDIMALEISPELLESTKFRIPPIMHEGPDGRPRYICDAEEGDIPRHISVPFPSMPKSPVSQQATQKHELLNNDSSTYTDFLWANAAVPPSFFNPYRTHISPSPQSFIPSNFLDDTFGSSDIRDPHGTFYLPHPIAQQHQFDSMNQTPQEHGNPTLVASFRSNTALADCQPNSPPVLLLAQNDGVGPCMVTTEFNYELPSDGHLSTVAPHTVHADIVRPTLTLPHWPHQLPSAYSSVSPTPTQSRCAQRSTSLPSLYEYHGLRMSPPVSHARSRSRPVTADSAIPQAGPSALLHTLARFPTAE